MEAGLFSFHINPPISLYYVQGLNLTPVHCHTALFGVYGMLGLGFTLFCLKALKPGRKWKETLLKLSFWSLNFGLIFMIILSMLPIRLLQAWASAPEEPAFAPPNTIAPNLPFPIGSALSHTGAGVRYQRTSRGFAVCPARPGW